MRAELPAGTRWISWEERARQLRQRAASYAWRLAGAPDLGRVLGQARAANPSARVIVKMDRDATFGVMSDMMVGLQEANATRFNVQTNLKGGAGAFAKTGASK